MRRFVDLHTHSTASDGSCRPEELIALADRNGLAAVALTDHDTTAGIEPACRAADAFPELQFIAGIELSACYAGGTMHLLGLGIDPAAPAMIEITRKLLQARNERNPKIIEKLRAMDIDITLAEVLRVAGVSNGGMGDAIVGRLHIAETLRRKGVIGSIDEAFKRYLASGAPAFIDKERLKPSEVIAAIHDSGGLSVLAHPSQLNYDNYAQLERVLQELVHAGLNGVEAYHSSHSNEQTRLYMELASRFSLGVTGGSDFHGMGKPDVKLGHPRVPQAGITEPFTALLAP